MIALAVTAPLAAQPPTNAPFLVLDTNPGPADGVFGDFTPVLDDTIYFESRSAAHGEELWRTDGTPEGTWLVKDINPGPAASSVRWGTVLGSTLYFFARDAATGDELWRSDGTEAGTTLVKDIRTGPTSSNPDGLIVLGDQLLFMACDAATGCELWKSDGTQAGTTLVKDIRPGAGSGLAQAFPLFAVLGGRVLFQADDGVNGNELWASDGTAAGTVLVKDIDPRPVTATQGRSNPFEFRTVGDRVFFWASDAAAGRELWKTDGSNSGTVLVKDIAPGTASGGEGGFRLMGAGGNVFFPARDPAAGVELFVSDGTAAGTTLLHEFVPGPASGFEVREWADMGGGVLLFVPLPGVGRDAEPWRSDGTPEGTVRVRDINPTGDSYPEVLRLVDGVLYFGANDGITGRELWRSDGTEAGTFQVADTNPGSPEGGGVAGGKVNGLVLFAATNPTLGWELWAFDPNRPPVADAGPDQQVVVGEDAILDGSASSDPDGQELTFEWHDSSSALVSTSATLTVTPPIGSHVYTLTVDDGVKSASDEVTVHVVDVARPTIEVAGVEGGSGMVATDPPSPPCANAPGTQAFCPIDLPTGTLATLVPQPAAGSTFDGWSGACSGMGPCQVEIADTLRVRATFRGPRQLEVTVLGETMALGSVTVTPAGGTCAMSAPGLPQVCRYPFGAGEVVTLTAAAGPQSGFLGWSGACSGTGPCQVTMADHRSVLARFAGQRMLFTLLLSEENGVGAIRLDPPGGSCELTVPGSQHHCEQFYAYGDVVTLTPVPTGQSVFAGWIDPPCAGTTGPCVVTLSQDTFVAASFRGPRLLGTFVQSLENGTGAIRIEPPNTVCEVTVPGSDQYCENHFTEGDVVTLTPVPTGQSVFAGWIDGPCAGTTGPCVVTMSQHTFMAGSFRGPQLLNVDVLSQSGGVGAVRVEPPGALCELATPGGFQHCEYLYTLGDVVTLTAEPGPLSAFAHWDGACTGTGPCQVAMSQVQLVLAVFQGPHLLGTFVGGEQNGVGAIRIEPPNVLCELTTPGGIQFCEHAYTPGEVVRLTPIPAGQSAFGGWFDGPCTGSTDPCEVTMSQQLMVAGRFIGPQILTVDVTSFTDGLGSVRVEPPGALCELTTPGGFQHCEYLYTLGDVVTLTAEPGPLSEFAHWDGACTGTGSCQVAMSQAQFVTAVFQGPRRLSLDVFSPDGGLGAVRVEPPGALCEIPTPGGFQTCPYLFADGQVVTLTPEPGPLAQLRTWGGACEGAGTGPCQVTMSEDRLAFADFQGPRVLAIDVIAHAGAFAVVYVAPPEASCQTDQPGQDKHCELPYADGEIVTLAATPLWHEGVPSIFLAWSGACSGTDPICQVTMSEARNVRAEFAGARVLTLDLLQTDDGLGGVLVQPAGETCQIQPGSSGATCTYTFAVGDLVRLTPVPQPGSTFTGWAGVPCTPFEECTFFLSDNVTATATFLGPRELVLTAQGDGTGTVHVDPPGEVCNPSLQLVCIYSFANQQPVTLTAVAGPGSTFVGWSTQPPQALPCPGTGPCVVTMSEDLNIVARFEGPRRLYLSVYGSIGGGSVLINPPGTTCSVEPGAGVTYCPVQEYAYGQHVILLPTPAPGSEFEGWSSAACSGTGPCELDMTEDRSVSARFRSINEPPVAYAGGPYTGVRGQPIVFDGGGSFDPDGDTLTYQWSFGDGTSGSGVTPSHVYAALGTFTVALVVSDGELQSMPHHTTATITNLAPSASLTSPANGSVFTAPASVSLAANAADPDGSVALVEFLANGAEVGEDASAPYEFAWAGVPAGTYTLTARATDETGTSTDSAPIQIVVNAPDIKLAPTADAYVRDGSSSNTNFGTALTLEVQKAPGSGSNRWTYLKFDTSSVASVSSVRLRLFGNLSAPTGTTVRTQVFSMANTSWSETGIKWNNKPSTGTSVLDTETIANNTTAGRWYEWDVTAFVQQQKAVGRDVIALALKNEANSGPQAVFRSRQSAINRPELVLVP